MEKLFMIADGLFGIYAPEVFANRIAGISESMDAKLVCDSDDLNILRKGPDHPEYLEAWIDIERDYVLHDGKHEWSVFQDDCGNIWLIRDDAEPGIDHEFWEAD